MIRPSVGKQALFKVGNEPEVIGVDDWAWRRSGTYGTIIVDLERRKVIALLPDRGAGSLTDWLLAHPRVETVARDSPLLTEMGL